MPHIIYTSYTHGPLTYTFYPMLISHLTTEIYRPQYRTSAICRLLIQFFKHLHSLRHHINHIYNSLTLFIFTPLAELILCFHMLFTASESDHYPQSYDPANIDHLAWAILGVKTLLWTTEVTRRDIRDFRFTQGTTFQIACILTYPYFSVRCKESQLCTPSLSSVSLRSLMPH